jgi:hypothetical protein
MVQFWCVIRMIGKHFPVKHHVFLFSNIGKGKIDE